MLFIHDSIMNDLKYHNFRNVYQLHLVGKKLPYVSVVHDRKKA